MSGRYSSSSRDGRTISGSYSRTKRLPEDDVGEDRISKRSKFGNGGGSSGGADGGSTSRAPSDRGASVSEPVGNSNSNGRFVWRKKVEQERKRGVIITDETEAARMRQLEAELEDAKRQRAIRDAERIQREADIRAEQREREGMYHDLGDEIRFIGRQHYMRQAIRLRNRRGTAIDEVARVVRLDLSWLSVSDDGRDVIERIMGIGRSRFSRVNEENEEDAEIQLERFLKEVDHELEYLPDFPTGFDSDAFTNHTRTRFWNAVRDVVVLKQTQIRNNIANNGGGGGDSGVHAEVLKDVNEFIAGKSVEKLTEMEREISTKLSASSDHGDGGTNVNGNNDKEDEFGHVDFWAVALERIRSCLSIDRLKTCVRELCAERRCQRRHARHNDSLRESELHADDDLACRRSPPSSRGNLEANSSNMGGEVTNDDNSRRRRLSRFTIPKPSSTDNDYPGGDTRNNNNNNHNNRRRTIDEIEQDMVRAEAARGMSENETAFADEIANTNGNNFGTNRHHHQHHGRGRKPLYFNRVHTGYNWSKYNRTHYDHDNPPPKTVQGYKFNIFYPDLDDPSQTPTYTIRKTDNPDVAIITFKAGSPYEDIAFKIVNRPWERSHKRGFRSSFDRGVLQLWFHFQHFRYRR